MLKRGLRRWDSSDPERAPPPLPMNPRSMSPMSPATRSNVSPNIQAVAAKFTEKPSEHAPSSYTTNPMPLKSSPERSLVKGQHHKRMQSLQPEDTRQDARTDFMNYLENKSPERPLRATIIEAAKPRDPTKSISSPALRQDADRDMNYSLSSRYLSKPILGESTPPSATMLALQNMQLPLEPDPPSPSKPPKLIAGPLEPQPHPTKNTSMDSLSNQLHSLTDIASSLQREMMNLSRRSKDNATDLVSLKAATNARDEDIRKSLKDLSSHLTNKYLDADATRFDFSNLFKGGDGPNPKDPDSPVSKRSYSVPRMPSPNPFAFDRDSCVSPSPISDGSAALALLEKVLREMATKEGEERLLELVEEIKSRPAGTASDKDADNKVTTMLEEILNLVKEDPSSKALVRSYGVAANLDNIQSKNASPEPTRSRSMRSVDPETERALDLSNSDKGDGSSPNSDEVMAILRSVKNSVVEGGGMTNGVKSLVRELRGEVLGMGRELGRRLDEIETSRANDQPEDQPRAAGPEEISAIVNRSLDDLKEQLAATINESRQQSSDLSEFRSTMNSAAIYSVVKKALDEFELPQPQAISRGAEMDREDILETVREAWETYKPEIEFNNFGLERDEILTCLEEGLKSYQPQHEQAVTYDQVLAAVEDGMQKFIPPQIEHPPSISRDEIILTIRECLEKQPEPASRSLDEEHVGHLHSMRDEILDAVSKAMASHTEGSSKDSYDSGLGRDEIVSAVSDGLEAHFTAAKEMDEPRISRHDVMNAVNEAFDAQQSAVAVASALSTNVQEPSISREEIFSAIAEGIQNGNSITREIELNQDDLMEAITSGLNVAIGTANTNVGGEMTDRLQTLFEGMKEEFKQYSAAGGRDTEQVLDAIKDGLDVVRKEIETYVVTAADLSGKDEVIDTVKEGFRLLQADMEKTITDTSLLNASRGIPDTPELLDAMEKEFEHLRGTITTLLLRNNATEDKDEILDAIREVADRHKNDSGDGVVETIKQEFETLRERMDMSMVRAEPGAEKDEIISALREHFDNLREQTSLKDGKENDVVNTIKQEFESLRERMEMSVVRAEPGAEKDEIISALREHFDILRDETSRRDGNESTLSATSELLDAFTDGVGSIRDDLKKLLEKPTEFDNSEIVNAIKDGLADLKLEMDSLRGSNKELDDASTVRGGELMLANEPSITPDIDGLKALIAQLHDKVEAIETTPRAAEPAEDALKRSHLDEVLLALHEVQLAMGEMSTQQSTENGDPAGKQDIEVLEQLLLSTKTQLDELVFPSPDQVATPEHIGALETMIRDAKDSIAEFSSRVEAEAPTKSEIGTLEGLIKDIWVVLGEMKSKAKDGEEDESEKLLKSDLQTVEAMIFEVKTQVDELKLPDVDTLPTKTDIQELSTLVCDFREKMEASNELTAQGFDARKVEHGGLAEKIDEAKFVVGELGDELKSKLDGSTEGLTELKQLLEGLAITAESFTTVESIKELTDLINREFERSRGEEDAVKAEKEERDAATIVKHDETRAAIIVELGTKIDEKISEVLAKYEDANASLHSKFSETEERDLAHTESLTSTRSLAEDIKLVIGAMGDSVNETCERLSVDTKALIEQVDQSRQQMENMHNDVRSRQEQSQAENERAAAATDRVESKLLEFHPRILESVQEILTIVSQHYDHSQKSAEDFKSELSALPSNLPAMLPALPPPESDRALAIEDTPLHSKIDDLLEHTKNNKVHEVLTTLLDHSKNDQLHEKLDRALDQASGSNDQIYEKLNELLDHATNGNGPVHEKLDALLSRLNPPEPDHSVTQMTKLDEMHRDIMENSRRMNEMFAAQSALIAEDTERKRREAEEAAVALERRVSQREQVEAELVGLHEEKDSMLNMIHRLKAEKEDMIKQNNKLSKDLSGLETALEIRHEEMRQMEDRADGLEKRILEGVLDHARTVLLGRSNSVQAMNLKRNRSTRSTRSSRAGARSPSVASTASTAKEPKDSRSLLGNGVGMALKRMPTSLHAGTGAVQPNIGKERRILSLSHVTGNRGVDRQASVKSGITNLKRSHSVKSNSPRKSSWAGPTSVADKENVPFHEEDEIASQAEDAVPQRKTSYAESNAPTDRKTSYAESDLATETEHNYAPSNAGTDRRTSYAASNAGTERKTSYSGSIVDSVVADAAGQRRVSGVSSTNSYSVAESSVADHDHEDRHDDISIDGSDSEDDAQTTREDAEHSGHENQNEDHEMSRQIREANEAAEAEVMKLLAPPSDSGLGTDVAV
ncbi:Pc13g02880 [Penicillium rubens Wisconsin 54-1255]|uniref:Pc13g02880 protein n=1 Tax=Penicillium rubens (strain ATCC 28089 / DSM 1075 / NRRL 1951 / Wisconsin 54-1255) TaxID=500485 RepID=B6H1F5_PENRW|nr:Pc13g02880 [Penicillium rubens Wisconsin 54-1255]